MIGLLDCNNFYVSCERLFNPKLISKPVIVLSNNDGCVISRSDEAKGIGIAMGVPFFKIKDIITDHKVKVLSSNYSVYGDISNRIMNILKDNLAEIEIYSIDEAFFSLKRINNRERKCHYLANKILKWVGIPVSIGIAKTKTLAKITNRVIKKKDKYKGLNLRYKNVLEVTLENDLKYILENTYVKDIWGVGRSLSFFLNKNKINNALELKECNDNFVRKKKGITLQRKVLELRGIKCDYIKNIPSIKKSICVSRSFGRKLYDYQSIKKALIVYVQKAASKARINNFFCKSITVFLKTSEHEKKIYMDKKTCILLEPTIDLRLIWKISDKLLKEIYKNSFLYSKVGVILSDFYSKDRVQQSFINNDLSGVVGKRGNDIRLMRLIDRINTRFGYGKVKISSDQEINFHSNKNNLSWKMRSEYRAPCYTTSWCDIPKVKV